MLLVARPLPVSPAANNPETKTKQEAEGSQLFETMSSVPSVTESPAMSMQDYDYYEEGAESGSGGSMDYYDNRDGHFLRHITLNFSERHNDM